MVVRSTLRCALALAVVAAVGVSAKELPKLDAAIPPSGSAVVPYSPGPADSAKIRPGSPLHVDDGVGLPTFLWAAGGGSRAAADPAHSLPKAARLHLEEYAGVYRLASDEVAAAVVDGIHDTGSGVIVVTFRQEIDGIPVFRDAVRVAMNRSRELVAFSGYLAGRSRVKNAGARPLFELAPSAAIAAAFKDYSDIALDPADLEPSGAAEGGYVGYEMKAQAAALEGGLLLRPSRAKSVWFRVIDKLEPAFYVEIDVASSSGVDSDLYAYVISAVDGSTLLRHNLTVNDSYSYRVLADAGGQRAPFDGPQGNAASPHPTGLPDGYQPSFVAPNLVTLQNGPISTNDPWLPPGATETTGNNVEAYADIASPDGFTAGDVRATTTGGNTFDRIYDTSQQPGASAAQRMAAITQLFYDINYFHDWFYDAGFDEASRNAQVSNYGRGGLGNDSLKAEAQDSSGRNNANMSTPADGARPRMQMYIWDGNAGRTLTVTAPAGISGQYATGTAQFGPQSFDLTAGVVLVNDGSATTSDGCQTPFTNAAAVAGKIAFIDRGICSFTAKVKNAQLNGAVGALIANNTSAGFQSMPGTDATITIPSLFISQADGNTLRAQFGVGVNARIARDPSVDRDGDLDNQIVAHEWGHYISNRLIGNAVGLTNNQGGSMGEGWGDFHALLMTVRPEDALAPANANYSGVYNLAGYSLGGGTNGPLLNNSYYFGIRRVPYSTDFTKDPLTFRHITNGVALPNTAPIAYGADGSSNAAVHRSGEVWATMLWECYASLLRDTGRLTFDQARDRMTAYLVAAYKLTPSSPTFLEARDALLTAAYAGDPADYVLFWQAFARRGAGLAAVAPDRNSTDHAGVVESFVWGNSLKIAGIALDDGIAWCDGDGHLDNGETGRLTVTVSNTGTGALAATTATVTTSTPGVSFPAGFVLLLPPSSPTQSVSASLPIALTGAGSVTPIDVQVSVDDPSLTIAGPVTTAAAYRGGVDFVPNQSATDDVESPNSPWSAASDPALGTLSPWRRIAVTGRDHRWLGPDSDTTADHYLVSPPLDVSGTVPLSMTFSHRYSFEYVPGAPPVYYDGGVIEMTTDGGASWFDIGGSASPGYTGTLTGGTNPLAGRIAYVGISPGYPGFATVGVNLGTAYAGTTVRFRFRIGTDPAVPAPGWEIDQFAFAGITNLPFDALVDDRALCIDTDVDGTLDLTDCAPFDATTWAAPSAARDFVVGGAGGASLSWSPPSSPGGTATVYDVLRSTSASSFTGSVCVASDTPLLTAQDPDIPGTGAFYYLARSQDACGGTLGESSAGAPRSGPGCP